MTSPLDSILRAGLNFEHKKHTQKVNKYSLDLSNDKIKNMQSLIETAKELRVSSPISESGQV